LIIDYIRSSQETVMDADYDLFARVVQVGSLAEAGRQLCLSPAMVSKRLARLEQRLGARLIHRTTRRLATTDVGQVFYEEVTAILAAARAAEARVAGMADRSTGRLAISAPTSFGRMHVAPYLAGFLEANPLVDLDVQLGDGYVDLLADRIDVAIRIAATIDKSLVAHRLAASRRVLCAAPSYLAAQGAPATLEALTGHRLLAASNQSPWRLEGQGGVRSLPIDSPVRTNSSEVVRELALAGYGIALRSTWDVGAELASGGLVRLLPNWEGAHDVAIYAVHPRASFVPAAVRAFVDHLLSVFAGRPPWDQTDR
jgi:DNA-binding transcriptional LysR family regulator